MILSTLIQKKDGLCKVATATPATMATIDTGIEQSVADVATVAVADSRELQSVMLTSTDEKPGHSWLAHIEETEPSIIEHVLDQYRSDLYKRSDFIWMAGSVPGNFIDDKRPGTQCADLRKNGRCLAAQCCEMIASRLHEPIQTILRRREGYLAGADDPDRQPGRKLWSGLIHKGIQL
jgi:hypothetical protein